MGQGKQITGNWVKGFQLWFNVKLFLINDVINLKEIIKRIVAASTRYDYTWRILNNRLTLDVAMFIDEFEIRLLTPYYQIYSIC